MDRMLYIAMSGARQTMAAQAVNAQNLANVSTAGFREDLLAFASQEVPGAGLPSRVYNTAYSVGTNLAPGSIHTTGNDLDIAVSGEGWIAVQAPDGTEAYTRAGDLRFNGVGLLTTGAGHPVLGNGGPIAIPPAETIEVGRDGTISIRPVGQGPNTLAVVDRIKLVNPPAKGMEKGADGLMRIAGRGDASADAGVTVVSGALEMSNVNAVDALVNMMELSRQFEMHIKIMKTAQENDAASVRLLGMR
ncbi:MAG: flagellar basal-body rod protein FlgF [Gammaproteobacteria bacterium]|nr:MAG: flagellar basal-body rod protein FlgF [Gammaproteobacteria bacterium]TND06700.1 MAG: flagellar basal-body rod protein FlgF [Gammaproteobacteria bacterium]